MKISAKINELSVTFYVRGQKALSLLALGTAIYGLSTTTSFAEGTNYLSGLKADVGKTFGAGSDTEYFIYLAEGLMAAFGYIKTKNIMLLGGLPVLMAFTHWALK